MDVRPPRLAKHRGLFCVYFYEGAHRRRITLGTDNLAEAKAKFVNWQIPPRRPKRKKSYIYFIEHGCPERFIKVGVAYNVKTRLSGLQVGTPYPLRLLKTVVGDEVVEWRIHTYFKDLMVRGEWMRSTPELLAYIDSLPEANPIHEITL